MSGPARTKAASVSEYVADLPPQSARVVRRIRGLVKKTVPGCTEKISYGIPAFAGERIFMYCAAFKSHIGIYPPVRGDARLIQQLKPYANAKGSLRFQLSDPMPYALITRVAKALAKSYADKPARKPAARKSPTIIKVSASKSAKRPEKKSAKKSA